MKVGAAPKKGRSAALRGAKNTIGMLSRGCAMLHPGLFSFLPYGKTAIGPLLRLVLCCGQSSVWRGTGSVGAIGDVPPRALVLQLYFARKLQEKKGPGLKAPLFCGCFRGLKAPAPSVNFDLQL